MSDSIIKVENLSKSFIISHEGKERYTSLRDVVADTAKRFFSSGSKKNPNAASKEEFWAVKDVSFEIKRGDRVGIIGRNGAGKSTLLKILSRITDPTKGRIEINGRIASLLEVGTGFHPELTGRENIFLNGAILGMSRAEIRKKFDEIVAFAEVEQFLDTPVKRYSSGMYVRLAFAVAAHLEPEILIVDEVLAVGDAQFQKKCLGKMQDVSKNEGRTVLFVSHNMGVIAQLCNKGILLNKGTIEKIGQIDVVVTEYINNTNNSSDLGYEYDVTEDFSTEKKNFFNKIFTLNSQSSTTSDFSFDEPISVKVDFTINENTPNLLIGLALNDKFGNTVFTIFRSVTDFRNYDQKKYDGTVELPASLLAPNQYNFSFSIWLKDLKIYELLENICSVKIHDNGTELALFEGLNYGTILIKPKWKNA
jgi:lipopolysaccharide transport system ATP-binding protein